MELLHHFPKIPNTQKLAIVVTISLIFFTIAPLLTNPTFFLKQPPVNPSSQPQETISRQLLNGVVFKRDVVDDENCDIFTGEWVPNPQAPYYTNTTCWAIHEHQNCMKFGRPDPGFMKWRWKPDRCDMPLFNPFLFLEIVRGKSMAFVGDSVSRNHMQSLICLLSRVEYPVDVSYTPDENFKRWRYETYNFTIAMLWTPYLIKYSESDPNGPDHTGLFNLYLDEVDERWRAQVGGFDYAIVSSGHWHYRPSIFFENGELVGCHYCQIPNMKDLTMFYGYRKAFRTAFRAILDSKDFKGVMYLRTLAPSHFEGGLWNEGGNCLRQSPFRSNETAMDERSMELYLIQMEEYRAAEREARERGLRSRLRLMDTTQAMWLRPDGHPSRYGHPPNANVSLYNDCVHWCLPGPIDSWNDFLFHMLKEDGRGGLRDRRARASDRKMLF